MSQLLHIDESEVPRMCLELYREHGTTMAGLKVMYLVLDYYYYYYCYFSGQIESLSIKFQAVGYEFDNDEFHAFVHGKLPYEKLKPDPVLRNLLLSMPQRKIVCQTLTCFGLTEKFL